jgi:hypothetical protein
MSYYQTKSTLKQDRKQSPKANAQLDFTICWNRNGIVTTRATECFHGSGRIIGGLKNLSNPITPFLKR